MLWDSGHPDCWNACASVPGSKGLGLKWTHHWWHPSCVSRNCFFHINFKISLWWFMNQEFVSCWLYVKSFLTLCPLFLCWLTRSPGGAGNSFCSQIVLALVMEVNALVLEFTILIIDLVSYFKSHYLSIRNGEDEAWWKMIAIFFCWFIA